ncbi:MAG TPA: hemerythrin domain-containing protein [Bryobacteraceae bacterium]|nr:hemerythrin domain-containing protein [Bryobacteraceae bacterium]
MIQIQLDKAPPVADGPIDHLVACHRRIEHRLDTLERAGAALDQSPEASLIAIENSVRFMDVSGVLHTIDEEESVFPRIRNAANPDEIAYLDNLEAEHREADQVYLRLKEVATSLMNGVTPEAIPEYRNLVAKLSGMYRSHIASEDQVLMELGRRVLTPSELEVIQSEMRARRASA